MSTSMRRARACVKRARHLAVECFVDGIHGTFEFWWGPFLCTEESSRLSRWLWRVAMLPGVLVFAVFMIGPLCSLLMWTFPRIVFSSADRPHRRIRTRREVLAYTKHLKHTIDTCDGGDSAAGRLITCLVYGHRCTRLDDFVGSLRSFDRYRSLVNECQKILRSAACDRYRYLTTKHMERESGIALPAWLLDDDRKEGDVKRQWGG